MNWRKRLLRVIALSLSILGGVLGGAAGAKGEFFEMTGLPELFGWAGIAEYIISTVLGAFIGFCFIWFAFWFVHWLVTSLFEGVSEWGK